MLSVRQFAVVLALAVFVGACAAPTSGPPTTAPEPTAVPATQAAAAPTDVAAIQVPDEPTVDATQVEPMADDGAPAAGPVPAGGAKPAVQFIRMTDLNDLQVGQLAQLAVLAADSDGLDRVELQIDGQVVSTVTANQQTEFQGALEWTPKAAGEHNAVVIAYDSRGLPGQSEQRTVTVKPAEPTTAPAAGATARPPTSVPPTAAPQADRPAVSITALTPRVKPGEDIQIATNAVSEAGIVKLDLFMSNRLVDTWKHDPASGPPPRSAFQTLHFRRAREGQYDAWVRAYAADGQVGESVKERVRVRQAE
jgi:hypothetical protein